MQDAGVEQIIEIYTSYVSSCTQTMQRICKDGKVKGFSIRRRLHWQSMNSIVLSHIKLADYR